MVGTKSTGGRFRIVWGMGKVKELICTTHGHELRGGDAHGGGAGVQGRGE